MEINAKIGKLNQSFSFNTDDAISLTQKVARDVKGVPNAYFLTHPKFNTVISGGFIGDVTKGGACNCEDVILNPHGNGTHTECVGHVSKEPAYISDIEIPKFLLCYLIQAEAVENDGDTCIGYLPELEKWKDCDAVIINSNTTQKAQYFSGTNPCYIHKSVAQSLDNNNIDHILTDLPSLDKEEDGGLLEAHKAFFNYPAVLSSKKTITELLHIPKQLKEGLYVLSIEVAPIESDAAPSKVTLYPI